MIRKATESDMNEILAVYEYARETMVKRGNPTQWGNTYPEKKLLEDDIKKGWLYVLTENDEVHAAFAFIGGNDPTYDYIEGGAWPNDRPYMTIHRIGSDGKVKNVFDTCIAYCKDICANLRIDTHEKNVVMQHLIEKNGFTRCGIIYIDDGTPRIAYQYSGK